MKLRVMEIFVVLLALGGLFCAYRYYRDVIEPEQKLTQADEEQLALFEQVKPEIPLPTAAPASDPDPESPEPAQTEPAPEESPLAPAEEVNSAAVGWITIPGTHIDYPIVQGEDNDYYLHHGFDGKPNQELGCPFLDCRCERDFSGFTSIVYAHHMTRQRMFADVALFTDESYLHEHPAGYLVLDDGVHTVNFFAYLTVPSTAPVYRTGLAADGEKREYRDYLLETAKYSINMDINENSHLLLLSTCTFEYEEARGVLVGVIG